MESGARAELSRALEFFLETQERVCLREKTEVLVGVLVVGEDT